MEPNFQEDIEIDIDWLDKEWLRQPVLYGKYADLQADAVQQRDETKSRLEQKGAELELEMRTDPDKHGLPKVTDKTIAAGVLANEDYQDLQQQHNEAKYSYTVATNALAAFDHKKKALENLVHLFSSNYFSGPTEPHMTSDAKKIPGIAKEEQVEKKVTAQRKSLNRKRRKK